MGLKNEVLEILGPMQDQRHSKYLGLPSIIGKSKKEIFAEVKEKVEIGRASCRERVSSKV